MLYSMNGKAHFLALPEAVMSLRVHDHICHIYESSEDQLALTVPFIRHGLDQMDRCMCLAGEGMANDILAALLEAGTDTGRFLGSGALSIISSRKSLEKDGSFDPERMVGFLRRSSQRAVADGYRALRVIGDMTWALSGMKSSLHLTGFGARLRRMFLKHPCLAVFQYNRDMVSPEVMGDVIRIHPKIAYGGRILSNPYFIPGGKTYKSDAQNSEAEHILTSLIEYAKGEEILARSMERYRLIVEAANEGIWQMDENQVTTYVNKQMAASLGYEPHEMVGRHVTEFMVEQDLRDHKERMKKRTKGEQGRYERRFRHKDGSIRWMLVSPIPLFDDKSCFAGSFAMFTDITDRKHAETVYRDNIRLLEAIRKVQAVFIDEQDPKVTFTRVLDTIVEITDSGFGFLDEVLADDKGIYKLNLAMSNIAWDDESRRLYDQLVSRRLEFRDLSNLAGLPATERRTIVANDPSSDPRSRGIPEGHPAIQTYLGMPLFMGNEVVGVAGLANRKGGYSHELALFLEPLLSAVSGIIASVKAKRKEQEFHESLLVSENELRIRDRISTIFLTYPDEEMYAEILNFVLAAMQSEFGTFGFFAEDGSFVSPALSRQIYWEKCNIHDKDIIFRKGTFGGVWGRSMKERKTVIDNDGPFRMPAGHIPITNTMVTPVIFRGALISMIHLANKKTPYTEADRVRLEIIAGQIAPVLYARLQRDRMERERVRAEESLRMSEANARAVMDASAAAIVMIDRDGTVIDTNQVHAERLGMQRQDLIGRNVFGFFTPEVADRRRADVGQVFATGEPLRKEDERQGIFNEYTITPVKDSKGETIRVVVYAQDISGRIMREESRRLSYRVLEVANRQQDLKGLLMDFISIVREYFSCEAAGVRLLDEDGNIPYQGYTGFPLTFYEKESPLSVHTDNCMCIYVIKGMTDPSQPFFTPAGSFYMNGTTRFLATVSEEAKGSSRNECNRQGYESVALVPIRQGQTIIGLVHLADTRENMVPLGRVQVLEETATIMGAAIQRVSAQARLRESLHEKEILLKEVHHRVKNNLATITGLINLQRRGMGDERTAASLQDLGSRITSMALVHESLYRSSSLAVINLQDYLKALVSHLRASYGTGSSMLIAVSAPVEMGLDEAIPCGMIVNELLTNALKYAFTQEHSGRQAPRSEIAVSVAWDGERYTLTVSDNGGGIPADVNPESGRTLGLRIVKMLCEHQLGGTMELDRSCGTRFTISFFPRHRR